MRSPFSRIVAGPLSRAFSSRNARIFFGASLSAWTGLWMHRIGVAWLAWELTRSPAWVGLIAFADLAPAVLVSPIAGAVADRVDRVRLTMLSQGTIAAEAAVVAALAATGNISIGLLFALEMVSGTAACFSQPARQTLIPALVAREDLPAAVAANSLLFNVARFVGPGLAGPLIAGWGVAPAIFCNAIGHGFATLSMPWLRVDAAQRRGHPATTSLLAETLEGFRYAARHPGLGPIIAFSALSSVLLRGVQEILPPYVERLFGRGAESLAMLTAAFAVGALVSGLVVASRGRLQGTTRIAVLAILAQAAATAGFVATNHFAFALLCGAAIGAAASAHGISVQVLAQTAASPSMRGRVMSLWALVTRACPALGALALGLAGEAMGLRIPTLVAVTLTLLVFAWGMSCRSRIAASLETSPERKPATTEGEKH
ncbi:MFS transporter [Pararoseomonas baculiformis]|uniref:MFS transporter n=1 Tax=Pararoseomonas baculiformis TaxID=2820812 RepID=UPI001FD801A0|nr:MFS transporter [Pararoseomonas baculiformis]